MSVPSVIAFRPSCLIAIALQLSLSVVSNAVAFDRRDSNCPALFNAQFVDQCFSEWSNFLERQGFDPQVISCIDDPTAVDGEMLTAMHFLTANPNAFLYGILASSGPFYPLLASMFTSVPYAHYPLMIEKGQVCGAFFSVPELDLQSYEACRWEILRSATWRKYCSSPSDRLDR